MSFLRHEEIYPCGDAHGAQGEGGELRGREGAILPNHALAHRNDESPAGYSSAGCAPAEPASASPASAIIVGGTLNAKIFSANGKLSPLSLSQLRGAVQICHLESRLRFPRTIPPARLRIAECGRSIPPRFRSSLFAWGLLESGRRAVGSFASANVTWRLARPTACKA